MAGIVSSGRAGDVLIGPAGTGKSYTVSALAQVWAERVGGRVLGLATTEIATRNLAEDGVPAVNTARFLAAFTPDERGNVRDRVRRGDLFVVDEAGMCSTAELARIADIVTAGGGKLVYTGDQGQLTSVGAGGMLALLVADNGAHQLEQVHRFDSDWERQASLRLRAGDTSVIPEYEDRGRLQAGTVEQMQAAAVRGYLADTLDGKDSLLIVGSNEHRRAALAPRSGGSSSDYGVVEPTHIGRLGPCAGNVRVSVGDRVQARQVDRTIRVDGGQHVANRAVYTVLGLDPDGALRVRGTDGGIAHLPRRYVDEHLTLAYASTVHAAQGRTVTTCHALLDEAAAREAAYVALSRGREANYAYLVAQRDPDAHEPQRLDGTAAGRLAGVLGNVEARHAAEVERRIGERDGASLAWIGTQWDEVSKDAARPRYTAQLAQVLEPGALAALTAEPGWPRLIRAVREAELAGHNSEALLASAVQGRRLDDAARVSDVLRYRVRVLAGDRTPEQPVGVGQWTALAPPVDGPVGQFAHELAVLAEDRQFAAGPGRAGRPAGLGARPAGSGPQLRRPHRPGRGRDTRGHRGGRRGRGRAHRVGAAGPARSLPTGNCAASTPSRRRSAPRRAGRRSSTGRCGPRPTPRSAATSTPARSTTAPWLTWTSTRCGTGGPASGRGRRPTSPRRCAPPISWAGSTPRTPRSPAPGSPSSIPTTPPGSRPPPSSSAASDSPT